MFDEFLNKIIQTKEQVEEIKQEDKVELNEAKSVKSEIDTSSDEDTLYIEYSKEKPHFRQIYQDIYNTLKANNPTQTKLEQEQLQQIAELQARVVIYETELFVNKRINQELKMRQQKQSSQLEQLQKEKDIRTQPKKQEDSLLLLLEQLLYLHWQYHDLYQMRIGYDKQFFKLNEKMKNLESTQRQIKRLAYSTPKDYMENALKRAKAVVKISTQPVTVIDPPKKTETQSNIRRSTMIRRQISQPKIIKK